MQEFASEAGDQVVVVSAQVEAELKGLEEDERADYLESLGVQESGCGSLVQATYRPRVEIVSFDLYRFLIDLYRNSIDFPSSLAYIKKTC